MQALVPDATKVRTTALEKEVGSGREVSAPSRRGLWSAGHCVSQGKQCQDLGELLGTSFLCSTVLVGHGRSMPWGTGTGLKGKAFASPPETGTALILQTGPSPSLLSLGRFKPLFCT